MILGKLKRKFFRPTRVQDGFYPLAPTCQVRRLSLIYEQYFGRRTNGTFVEVGAFDGEYASNTSGLADIGWQGVYVEPVPEFGKRCTRRHRDNTGVRVINVAVGDRKGQATIHVGGPLSTASDSMKDNFRKLPWASPCFDKTCSHTVPMTTLEEILTEAGIRPGFEVLVVDVEGYEWNVMKVFDIARWSPQMIIIELHDQNDDYWGIREDCKSLVAYFADADYKVIWKDFTNTIYVPAGSFPMPLEARQPATAAAGCL